MTFTLDITTPDQAAQRRTRHEAKARAAAAQALLNDTDWMILRQAETGKPVPDDVSKARRAARQALGCRPDADRA